MKRMRATPHIGESLEDIGACVECFIQLPCQKQLADLGRVEVSEKLV
jgi:hypothetical protein